MEADLTGVAGRTLLYEAAKSQELVKEILDAQEMKPEGLIKSSINYIELQKIIEGKIRHYSKLKSGLCPECNEDILLSYNDDISYWACSTCHFSCKIDLRTDKK